MTAPAVSGAGLSRRFGDATVLSEVSLEVARGEWVALVGPSGSGKTTLLQILGLLDRPTSGRVLIDGADAWGQGDAARTRMRLAQLGFVFQQHNLLPQLSAVENVALPAWRLGGARGPALQQAHALLDRFGLEGRAHHRAGLLSAGEAQRVAIARALVNRPAVVLADEPTGSLDSAAAARTLEAFGQVCAGGVALLMVTHDGAAGARASRRLSMSDGRLHG